MPKNYKKRWFQNFLQEKKSDQSPVKYSANGYTSFGVSHKILNDPLLNDLKMFIENCVQECHKETNLAGTPILGDSWFSINRKYTYHEEHNHLPDIWSGVYYVQADQDHPGLTLVNGNQKSNWPRSRVTQLSESNTPTLVCAVETGSLLIFPSYLWHKVDQQMVDKERITVAFNYGI